MHTQCSMHLMRNSTLIISRSYLYFVRLHEKGLAMLLPERGTKLGLQLTWASFLAAYSATDFYRTEKAVGYRTSSNDVEYLKRTN